MAGFLSLIAATTTLFAQTAAPPQVLTVSRSTDDGSEGTLRWAIETSNASPGHYRIAIAAADGSALVIRPERLLPPIKGPVHIEGTAWRESGTFAVIDGSLAVPGTSPADCPGATPGQSGANVRTLSNPGLALVDTRGVEIVGIEVRNFCIGVLIHRASGNVVSDSRLVANRGGAGIMLTGDDGEGRATTGTTSNNKVLRNLFSDNGDGLELTRGASFNLVADNLFRSTDANPEPSQGIEILLGHDNVITRNRFEGYSDGIQINSGHRNDVSANVFIDNTFGISLTGLGNVLAENRFTGNAVAIAVRPTGGGTLSRITRNVMIGNGAKVERCWVGGSCDPALRRGAIVFGLPSGEHAAYVGRRSTGVPVDPARLARICPDGAPACQPQPNGGIAAPRIDTAIRQTDGSIVVEGALAGAPSSLHSVEVFGNASADGAEAETYLGQVATATGRDGTGRFSLRIEAAGATRLKGITATVTSPEGATSELARAQEVSALR